MYDDVLVIVKTKTTMLGSQRAEDRDLLDAPLIRITYNKVILLFVRILQDETVNVRKNV